MGVPYTLNLTSPGFSYLNFLQGGSVKKKRPVFAFLVFSPYFIYKQQIIFYETKYLMQLISANRRFLAKMTSFESLWVFPITLGWLLYYPDGVFIRREWDKTYCWWTQRLLLKCTLVVSIHFQSSTNSICTLVSIHFQRE